MEKTLDSLLAGRSGSAVVLKDRARREYESPARVIAQPVAGHDVAPALDAAPQGTPPRAPDDALRLLDAPGRGVPMRAPAPRAGPATALRARGGPARASA